MRELKFKAYHKPTKKIFKVHGWHSEFVFEDTLNGCGTTETNPAKIEDCEILQYSGLKDRTDNEIYENDVLFWKERKYIVKFNSGMFQAVFLHTDGSKLSLCTINKESTLIKHISTTEA